MHDHTKVLSMQGTKRDFEIRFLEKGVCHVITNLSLPIIILYIRIT